MADAADNEHFDWLVEGRSRDQQPTLKLYKIIRSDREEQPVDAGSSKEKWTAAQSALEAAIASFAKMIENA